MSELKRCHRLDGLEPDNLLAFLALLGLLRALETARPDWRPRAAWDLDSAPLRPFLKLQEPVSQKRVAEAARAGVRKLAQAHDFGGRSKLKLSAREARELLESSVDDALKGDGTRAALWSALVSDAAAKPKADAIDRTPFCLLDVAQTNFLKSLAAVVSLDALPGDGDREEHLLQAIARALFATWRREDDTPSFRWDPVEDSRHAYRWAAPTDEKQGVEHGANVLAAIGLPILTVVPQQRRGEVRLLTAGGEFSPDFSFAWPIWREPASLQSIRCLLLHPDMRTPGALAHLGLEEVRTTRRINAPGSKYQNFTLAHTEASSSPAHTPRP
jgi:hypothetical protein